MSRSLLLFGWAAWCLCSYPSLAVRAADNPLAAEGLRFITMYKDSLEGLERGNSIAISPDGRHVFATSDRALLVLERDAVTGELTFVEAFEGRYDISGIKNIRKIDRDLSPKFVVVSPTGTHVYVIGREMTVFLRDKGTGRLAVSASPMQNLRPQAEPVLHQVEHLSISPDGKNAYAVGRSNDTLGVYQRDSGSGQLTLIQVFQDVGGDHIDRTNIKPVESAIKTNNLASPQSTVVSPDGKSVYVISYKDSAVTSFSREAETGKLTETGFIAQRNIKGHLMPHNYGLMFGHGITASADGKHLFVASISGHLSIFARDQETGTLSFTQKYPEEHPSVGLRYALWPVVAPSGKYVYVAASGESGISVFHRDAESGQVAFVKTVRDEEEGVDGLAGVQALCISPDGRHVYTISTEQAISVFATYASSPAEKQIVKPLMPSIEELQQADKSPLLFVHEPKTLKLPAGSFVESVAFGNEDRRILAGVNNHQARSGAFHAWDWETREQIQKIDLVNSSQSYSFSPDRQWGASENISDERGFRREVTLWDLKSGDIVRRLPTSDSINSICFTSDGKRIAAGMSDFTIRVWNTENGELTASYTNRPVPNSNCLSNQLAFSPDNKHLLGYCEGKLRKWDLSKDDSQEPQMIKLSAFRTPLLFANGGKVLICRDERIRFLDFESLERLFSLKVGPVEPMAISPDNQRLAIGYRES